MAKGVSGKLLLVEKIPDQTHRGVVIAVAPLVGLNVSPTVFMLVYHTVKSRKTLKFDQSWKALSSIKYLVSETKNCKNICNLV